MKTMTAAVLFFPLKMSSVTDTSASFILLFFAWLVFIKSVIISVNLQSERRGQFKLVKGSYIRKLMKVRQALLNGKIDF